MGLEMKKILVLIGLILATSFTEAAKPIVDVPNLPQKSELELYEESEGLFAIKVIEYYKMAVALESQLRILGVVPINQPIQPIFEELEDMDIKILRKYHKIASSLYEEVKIAPDSDRQILLDRINDLESKLRDTIAIYTIEKGAIRNQMLDLMVSRIKEIEDNHSNNIELALAQNFVNCMDYNTWFSIAGVSKLFFSQGKDVVKNDPGIGIQTNLNLGKLVGFWDGFELRYEYLAPKFFTEYRYPNDDLPYMRHQWNTNVHNISAGGKAIVNKNSKLVQGFNIYVGYFWADAKLYNLNDAQMNWDGAVLSLDYFLASPSCQFPVEIFVGMSVYNSFSRNLVFQTPVPNYELTDLGKTHLAVNLGLRYNIWRSPF